MLDKPDAYNGKSRLPHDRRCEQLIDATIQAIARFGLSNVTLDKVAKLAGLTAGMVNFHFKTKEELLRATLTTIADEFSTACDEAVAAAGPSPAARLLALSQAALGPEIATPEKLAVWYAFWGEAQARDTYMEICGSTDTSYYRMAEELFAELAAETGSNINARAAAFGFYGIVDSVSTMLVLQRTDHHEAMQDCLHYLRNHFPDSFADNDPAAVLKPNAGPAPTVPPAHSVTALDIVDREDLDRLTLPAWTYCSEDFTAAEIEAVHRPAWQMACHVSEIGGSGDFVTLNVLGKPILVLRGEDGVVRTFHNVCRHRAHEVVRARSGTCAGVLRCPYHAWTYDTRGALKGIAASRTFPQLDKNNLGLFPLECEVFCGFVFIRLREGGPSVAERYAPYAAELAPYRIEDMVPISDLWECEVAADWKNVWDNYLEDYHFAAGHPGLSALMSKDFDRDPDDEHRTIRLSHKMRERVEGSWSTRMYARTLPEGAHLPEDQRRRWSYYYLYPAVSLETYPDMVDFFHVVPLAPGRSMLRWRAYGLPDASRELNAAQWLNRRINFAVHGEDSDLIESVQRNLEAGIYERGVLSDKEVNVKALHDWVGADMPNAR